MMKKPTKKHLLLLLLAVGISVSSLQAQTLLQRFARWATKAVRPVHSTYDENGNTQAPLTTFDRKV